MTKQEARKEANRLWKEVGVDLEEGETKKDWIDAMVDTLLDDESRNN